MTTFSCALCGYLIERRYHAASINWPHVDARGGLLMCLRSTLEAIDVVPNATDPRHFA